MNMNEQSLKYFFNNNDQFYPWSQWPEWARNDILLRHKERKQRFQLMFFLTSNGLHPSVAKTWVAAASHHGGQFQRPSGDKRYDASALRDFDDLERKAVTGELFDKYPGKEIMDMHEGKVTSRITAKQANQPPPPPRPSKRARKWARLRVARGHLSRLRPYVHRAYAPFRPTRGFGRLPRLRYIRELTSQYNDAVSTLKSLASQGIGQKVAIPPPLQAVNFEVGPAAGYTRSDPGPRGRSYEVREPISYRRSASPRVRPTTPRTPNILPSEFSETPVAPLVDRYRSFTERRSDPIEEFSSSPYDSQ